MHSLILTSLLISLAINLCLFLIAFSLKSDKLTDASYALSFIALAVYDFIKLNHSSYTLIGLILVIIWATRIGSFLVYRVLKVGKDRRFDTIRDSFLKFGEFWLGQAITAWVLMLPFILAKKHYHSFSIYAFIGLAIWCLGLSIEAISDIQKYKFHKDPKNKNLWIDSGLWHYSRHPNYLGEILVWLSIYVYLFSSLSGTDKLLGLTSPIFISLVLCFISGIPILEKSADKKWGNNKDYIKYKNSTNILLLLPKK